MSQKDSLRKAINIGLLMLTDGYSVLWGILRSGLKVARKNWQYF